MIIYEIYGQQFDTQTPLSWGKRGQFVLLDYLMIQF
jgi:hypothetical protein